MKVKTVFAREVLDSRGNPTVEVEINGFRAQVPSGASTGAHEAPELRDGGRRYHGKGVLKAVSNVNNPIKRKIKGKNFASQKAFDRALIALDPQKARLGANAILGCSAAFCKAAGLPQQLRALAKTKPRVPVPASNLINGGMHAAGGASVQEYLVLPVGLRKTADRVRAVSEVYHSLKKIISSKLGRQNTNVGDEGGFVPFAVRNSREPLELIERAIEESGYAGAVRMGVDAAATSFHEHGQYKLDGRMLYEEQLVDWFVALGRDFKLLYIEDPFYEEDFHAFAELTYKLPGSLIVADDLVTTNPARIRRAIAIKSANCLLLKPNQIGTVSEAVESHLLAKGAGWKTTVSHRSGETEDAFLADFATAIAADFIKLGAPCRGERTAKYNELLRLAEKYE